MFYHWLQWQTIAVKEPVYKGNVEIYYLWEKL